MGNILVDLRSILSFATVFLRKGFTAPTTWHKVTKNCTSNIKGGTESDASCYNYSLTESISVISPSEMLAATLRYLASGDSMVSISYLFRLGKSTVSEIIRTVCYYIWQVLKDEYLIQPIQENRLNVARGFNETWNIPNCIGAIDGKLVVMQVYTAGQYFIGDTNLMS